MADDIHLLVVSGGHAYDRVAFTAMFESMSFVRASIVEHPAARAELALERAEKYDVVFFYDMCGIPAAGLTHDGADEQGMPPNDYAGAVEALLESGKGLILANHATVSWPNWPLWRQISGSSFMLRAGPLDGVPTPGSGYRGGHGPLSNATVQLVPDRPHPVLAELEAGFTITDELYLKTVGFESGVLPLLRADYPFIADNFSPPPLASATEQESWTHPGGSDLVVWVNACGRSPVLVTDLGDGPSAFGNPGFRTLIENGIQWVASADARRWVESTTDDGLR